ncbi:hypothetical protein SASPL_114852 [Salvia splendens]|uniref:Uncharacterized protein n=1 Tax=Salvia splendens TaxID=180675 RepID=A0A8X8Y4H2_SALSN|nr:hypothetical protein SASPL_114852 [Salvia splendens]
MELCSLFLVECLILCSELIDGIAVSLLSRMLIAKPELVFLEHDHNRLADEACEAADHDVPEEYMESIEPSNAWTEMRDE